jgi:serine/threonine protein kinase
VWGACFLISDRLLQSIDHPNVLKLIDSTSGFSSKGRSVKEVRLLFPVCCADYCFSGQFLLLFPICERGSIQDAVEAIMDKTDTGMPHPFPERDALRLFQGVCEGVKALHEKGWAHRGM